MFAKMALRYEPLPLPDRRNFSDLEMRVAADAFYDCIRRRHTVRDFSDRPVALSVIETCIQAAGTSPSGANHQPWHFVAIANREIKHRIRLAAEEEERKFYAGGAGDEWIKVLEPIGTTASKPHLDIAPWLIVVFAQRWGSFDDGTRFKNYYVPGKRRHRNRVSLGRLASCRSLDADPYTQSYEILERIAGPAILREAANDPGCRTSGRRRDGSGGRQD